MANSSAIQLADLALTWSNATADGDLSLIDSDLASDRDLETAILLSLFTDRRANNDDVPPSGIATDRRGWWADQFADVEGDLIGSRLWLLARTTLTNQTMLLAKQYATEALQWLLDDEVASSIGVVVTQSTVSGMAALLLAVTVQQPGRDAVTFKFSHVWANQQEDV